MTFEILTHMPTAVAMVEIVAIASAIVALVFARSAALACRSAAAEARSAAAAARCAATEAARAISICSTWEVSLRRGVDGEKRDNLQ